ncbi:MAG: uridine kinase [Endozoicomonadaceae bacterium]|nr:uridine kinase [Endozoicomonadaceae bacterium]
MSKKIIIVGIAGASASGKTLFAERLLKSLNSQHLCMISEDSYYKDQSHLSLEERINTNYDHPDSIDQALMLSHIKQLKKGHSIEVPLYDYQQHNRSANKMQINPSQVIIYEGILLFNNIEIRQELDLRFYIDTPLDICLIRRLKRDLLTRGRTIESVINQYLKTVRPMFIQFVETSRQYADLIIPKGGKNKIALDLLQTKIQSLIESDI